MSYNPYPPPPPYYNFNYGPPPGVPPQFPSKFKSKRSLKGAINDTKALLEWLEQMKKGGDKDKGKEKKPNFALVLAATWFLSPILTLGYAKFLIWALQAIH